MSQSLRKVYGRNCICIFVICLEITDVFRQHVFEFYYCYLKKGTEKKQYLTFIQPDNILHDVKLCMLPILLQF